LIFVIVSIKRELRRCADVRERATTSHFRFTGT